MSTNSPSMSLEESPKTLAIVLIDEYPIVRTGLRFFLSQQRADLCISESRSITDFYAMYPQEQPDIMILGIGQDLTNGCLEDLHRAKKWYAMSSIIIYDDSLNMPMIRYYFKIGIMGYLSKQSHPDELNKCISSVINGLPYISTETLIQINAPEEEKKIKSKKSTHLTQNELLIALYLIQGCSISFIAGKVGRKASTISTVKSTIMRKMKVDNIVKLKVALSMPRVMIILLTCLALLYP